MLLSFTPSLCSFSFRACLRVCALGRLWPQQGGRHVPQPPPPHPESAWGCGRGPWVGCGRKGPTQLRKLHTLLPGRAF